MRIRSIKPEFWTHEVMSALPAETALLALALLNYADDEGFFFANPRLVQSALFPLRELSRTVPVMLSELSGIGFVEVRECSSGRQIGVVKAFLQHQSISKPRRSRLRDDFDNATNGASTKTDDSSKAPGGFRDDSGTAPSGNGTGNGMEQGTGNREGRARARGGKNDRGSILPEEQPEPISSRLLKLNEIPVPHVRSEKTRWMAAEVQAVRDAGLLELSVADFAESVAVMQAFYAAKIATADERRYWRRTTLPTLLKNWASELDKARAWDRERAKANEGRL